MRKLKQAYKHDPENGKFGDCFRTCIAMILDLGRDEVPNFAEKHWNDSGNFNKAASEWLAARGLVLCFSYINGGHPLERAIAAGDALAGNSCGFIFSGMSRNGTNHATVAMGGEIWADPAIDDSGIVGPMDNGYYQIEFIAPMPVKDGGHATQT